MIYVLTLPNCSLTGKRSESFSTGTRVVAECWNEVWQVNGDFLKLNKVQFYGIQ